MARIRSIKPSFFTSEDVSVLPFRARLTWIGLWTHCDDQGRAKDNLRLIKAAIWPLDDVTLKDVEEDLETLAASRRIVRYEVGGRRYLAVPNFRDHQSPNKPTPSKLPAPPEGPAPAEQYASEPRGTDQDSDSRTTTGGLPEDAGRATSGRGEERRGGEGTRAPAHARDAPPPANTPPPPPPSKCPEHRDDPNPPPCRACADARKTRAEWDRQQAAADSARQSEHAHRQAEARQLAIANCRLCDPNGYVNGAVCNHDPAAAERTTRGAAMARDLLRKRP